ncbi:WSC domain protein, partial [Aureobasidium melanogenum]
MRSFDFSASALSVLALASSASAFWRMPCPGRVATERLDPIVNPGGVSGHVHTISGSNGFKAEMTYADARGGACSSCPIKQDMSNYWTPKLYYQSENGTFIDVPQAGDGQGVYGGMTVYYLQRGGPNNDNLTAFPEGFRMLAGDPFKRAETDDFAGQAVSFVCLDYSGTSTYTSGLPNKVCPDGLRAQVFFPSCWDGVNLDSSDHKSHMAYPTKYSYDNGPCPATHPVHLISIFYEIIYSTAGFDWWNGTNQPFVFAQGDPTGYGFHGDFINGWDVPTLQEATNTCNNDSGLITDCPVFDFFTNAESQACVLAPTIDEAVTGELAKLPGCNPVTYGPGEAPHHEAGCTDNATLGYSPVYYQNVTGWDYVGCAPDSVSSRTLNGSTYMSSDMTVESCLSYCKGKGLNYAGLEYATQCYCGSSLPAALEPTAGVLGNCFSPCAGNSSQYCGGASRLSIYYTSANLTESTISCPSGNGQNFTTPNNATFNINCAGDSNGKDLNMVYVNNGIQECVKTCSTTSGCVAASLSGTACYMKSTFGTMRSASGVQHAQLMSGGAASSSSSSSSAASSTKSSSASSSAKASSTSSSASATSSLPSSATNSAGSVYNLYYSSDSGQGSFTNTQASSSYTDCMTACDANSKCTAFTYVGGKNGVGSGTCWLKTQMGNAVSSNSNVLSGSRVSMGNKAAASSSSSSAIASQSGFVTASGSSAQAASSTASSATATATSTVAACPNANNTIYTDKTSGAQFLIECGVDHAGGDLKMVYVSSFASCIQTCAQTTGCVDVSLSGTACYMKKSVGSVVKSGGILGAKLIPASSASVNVNVAQKVASTSKSSSASSQKATSTMKTSTKATSSTKATTTSTHKA